MSASLLIDQVGLPAGTAGFSRADGLSTGAVVTCTSVSSGITHEVSLLAVPLLDVTALASLTQTGPTTWEFTPTALVFGTYRILLVVDAGLPTEARTIHTFAVRTPAAALRIPAYNEQADPNASLQDFGAARVVASETNAPNVQFPLGLPFGWWDALRETMESVETLSVGGGGGGGAPIWQEGGVTAGNVYGTWAAAHAAVLALPPGARMLMVDDSITPNPTITAAGSPWDLSQFWFKTTTSRPMQIDIEDGATFTLASQAGITFEMLYVRFLCAAGPAFTKTTGGLSQFRVIGGWLDSRSATTPCLVDDGITGGNLSIRLENGARTLGDPVAQIIAVTNPAMAVTLLVDGNSNMSGINVLSAPAATITLVSAQGYQAQSAVTTTTLVLASDALYQKYTDTVPTLGATNVQAAIDVLKPTLWAWNGTDNSQYDVPVGFGGAVNPDISITSTVDGESLTLSLDAGSPAGSGFSVEIFDPVDYQAMILRWISLANAGFPVALGESFYVGMIIASAGPTGAGCSLTFCAGVNAGGGYQLMRLVGNGASPGASFGVDVVMGGPAVWLEWDLIATARRDPAGFPPLGVPTYSGTWEATAISPGVNAAKEGMVATSSSGFAGVDWGNEPINRIGFFAFTDTGVVAKTAWDMAAVSISKGRNRP